MTALATAVCSGSGRQYPKLAGYRSMVCEQCYHAVPLDGDGTLMRHDTDGVQLKGYVPRPRIVRALEKPPRLVSAVLLPDLAQARGHSDAVFAQSLEERGCADALAEALRAEYRLAGWLR